MWHIPAPETTAATKTVDLSVNRTETARVHTIMMENMHTLAITIMTTTIMITTMTITMTISMIMTMPVMPIHAATTATVIRMTTIITSMCGKATGKR